MRAQNQNPNAPVSEHAEPGIPHLGRGDDIEQMRRVCKGHIVVPAAVRKQESTSRNPITFDIDALM